MRLEGGDVGLHGGVISLISGQDQLKRVVIPPAIIEISAANIVRGNIDQPVIAAATAHKIPPAAASQHIIALATDKEIIAGTTIELIIAPATQQLVLAATAFKHVIALETDDEVIAHTAAQEIVAACAKDQGAIAHLSSSVSRKTPAAQLASGKDITRIDDFLTKRTEWEMQSGRSGWVFGGWRGLTRPMHRLFSGETVEA